MILGRKINSVQFVLVSHTMVETLLIFHAFSIELIEMFDHTVHTHIRNLSISCHFKLLQFFLQQIKSIVSDKKNAMSVIKISIILEIISLRKVQILHYKKQVNHSLIYRWGKISRRLLQSKKVPPCIFSKNWACISCPNDLEQKTVTLYVSRGWYLQIECRNFTSIYIIENRMWELCHATVFQSWSPFGIQNTQGE